MGENTQYARRYPRYLARIARAEFCNKIGTTRPCPRPPKAGRKKGTPNKKTLERMAREEAAKLLSKKAYENDLPLDYMLRVMRDPNTDPHRRDAMAKAAAPYLHPQLSAVEHRVANADGSPIGPTVVHRPAPS
jgi:hypothetical protein